MAVTMIPRGGRFVAQPTGPLRINRNDPLTRNITTLIPFRDWDFDLVTGKQVTIQAGYGRSYDSTGASIRGNGSTACASIPLDLSAWNFLSLSFWLYWDSYANDDKLALEFTANYNTNNGFIVDPNSGAPAAGNFQVGAGGGSGGSSRSFARPSAAKWHHYAIVFDKSLAGSGSVSAAYVDGVSQSLTTTATAGSAANFPSSTLYVFSRNNASLFGAGRIANLVIRGGYTIQQDEVTAEYRRPQALYESRSIWVPVTPSAGGASAALSGQSVTTSAGTTAPSATVSASGQAATASSGTLSPTRTVALSGLAATASAGTLAPTRTVALSGSAVTASAGTVTYSADGSVTVALSGQAVTASAGTASPGAAIAASGAAITTSAGTLTLGIVVPLAGSSSTASAGTVVYSSGGVTTRALTGEAVTASAGTLTPAIGNGGLTLYPVGHGPGQSMRPVSLMSRRSPNANARTR